MSETFESIGLLSLAFNGKMLMRNSCTDRHVQNVKNAQWLSLLLRKDLIVRGQLKQQRNWPWYTIMLCISD